MFELIDFTECRVNPKKSYLGASSPKKCIIYNSEQYMVKFPTAPDPTKTDLSYSNGCLSEYLGCHIFEIADIPVQKTLLGKFRTQEGKTKLVVACKDLEKPETVLMPFAGLKNQNARIQIRGDGMHTLQSRERLPVNSDVFELRIYKPGHNTCHAEDNLSGMSRDIRQG